MRSDEHFLSRTIESYNATSSEYSQRFSTTILEGHISRFQSMLPYGDLPVLDAGCGGGRDAVEMAGRGLRVVGVDLSEELLRVARIAGARNLVLGDIRRLPFRDSSFSGIWSCASLVHMPPAGVRKAVSEFKRLLVPNGILFVTVRHGSGTEWREDGAGGARWFQLYSASEVEDIITEYGFSIETSVVEPGLVRGKWVSVFAVGGS
ncbi:methyltransferase domain-containing protein [Streptomyces antibioticus]|uniref:class I SAM-dependent methyltransferase n=1 Tax=Streptomyces antibioticus TaxID=1890 RepID=UPI003D716E4F